MTGFRLHTHPMLREAGLVHGWTDADGPDFKGDPGGPDHPRVVGSVVAATGLEGAAWARQVHGGTVLRVTGPGLAGEADALWTDVPGLGVMGRSADCPLVLVAGSRPDGSRAWGFAHASWRSALADITGSLVGSLRDGGVEPGTMKAVVCPSAGPSCYEVGPEVRDAFEDKFGKSAEGWFRPGPVRPHLDLWLAAVDQLSAQGVLPDEVAVTGVCTICGTGYPSYRREGDAAGRFAAIIGVRSPGNA